MTEIEVPRKTCMECGTKCEPLVLVCPSCKSVLPDGDVPSKSLASYEIPPEVAPSRLPSAIGSGSTPVDVAIGKIAIFLGVLAFVILYLSSVQK